MTATAPHTPADETPIDVTFGARGPAPCGICHRQQPAEPRPVIEFEFEDGRLICTPCLSSVHPGLAAAHAVLRTLAASMSAPDGRRIADDCLAAIVSGVELLTEDTPRPLRLTPRPNRTQPRRGTRHGRRR